VGAGGADSEAGGLVAPAEPAARRKGRRKSEGAQKQARRAQAAAPFIPFCGSFMGAWIKPALFSLIQLGQYFQTHIIAAVWIPVSSPVLHPWWQKKRKAKPRPSLPDLAPAPKGPVSGAKEQLGLMEVCRTARACTHCLL
jgi:hypothetical protein